MFKKGSAIMLGMLLAFHVNAQFSISGRVLTEVNVPLQGASIVITESGKGATSGPDGRFIIKSIKQGNYTLAASYLGYEKTRRKINVDRDKDLGDLILQYSAYQGEEATISALRAGEKTPMAYTNMDKEQIRSANYGQDVPYIISSTPSVITNSDAGNGIGYTSMRIRGTDGNRINVTVNGIPLNDAESHSVFWVDLPELASSASQIQIQRGVGTSTNGAAAFGATVNLQTTAERDKAFAEYDLSGGSFNTLRNSVQLGTGLIKDKFSFEMRLSDLYSDGYIDRSWTDLQSYYLAASLNGASSSLRFITFGGFEELYQAWGGVPSSLLKTDRTYNGMGEYVDTSGRIAYYDNQIDHYDQMHYQLHYSKKFGEQIFFNSALHYTKGAGYYEEYESDQAYTYYNMKAPILGSDTLEFTNLVRQKWLDNDFYGAIASLNYESENWNLIVGGGWNLYSGLHFGKVIWAETFGENSIGHNWYEGQGKKTDWNMYTKYYYDFGQELNSFVDLQIRGIKHNISGFDANNRDVTQEHSFLFFNPKAGLNYIPAAGQKAFISYARANREPNRNNYTDAPDDRMPVKETLNDFEAGYSIQKSSMKAAVTLYYMKYNDQLVLTGQINEVGYPVMTNIPESYRAGVEFEFALNYMDKIGFTGNLALSDNRVKSFTNYIDNWDYWNDPANEPYQLEESIENAKLAYSPAIVAGGELKYSPIENVSFSIISKYVGQQYLDNTSNPEYVLDAYLVNNLKVSYQVFPNWSRELVFSLLVANILDAQYETNAWIYRYSTGGTENFIDGYYPQAGRHLFATMHISF